jgi:hypothetical protein
LSILAKSALPAGGTLESHRLNTHRAVGTPHAVEASEWMEADIDKIRKITEAVDLLGMLTVAKA